MIVRTYNPENGSLEGAEVLTVSVKGGSKRGADKSLGVGEATYSVTRTGAWKMFGGNFKLPNNIPAYASPEVIKEALAKHLAPIIYEKHGVTEFEMGAVAL